MSSWLKLGRLPRVPKWALGVAVATPVAATVQGCLMLQNYRRRHGHAPHPISPSQGLVVVSSSSSVGNTLVNTTASVRSAETNKPLRLLVIGDSLAAGVGTSQSGTPVLPQSIARALSGASDGRAVHWTCIGTPGASASQIVHDLGAYDETPSLLERKHVEWQLAKQRAQEWWQHRKKLQEERKKEAAANRVKQWWMRLQKDVDELKEVLQVDEEEVALQTRRLTRRKTTLDPDIVAQYDIAVVLTGLNDLKDAFLPFMVRASNPDGNKASGFKEALFNIVHALQSKMKFELSDDHDDESTPSHESITATSARQHHGPLVVFPAIPSSPLPMTQYPPLSWFLVPLIQMMDNNKRLLAQRFPELVLYVDPPSPSDFRDHESGRGDVHDTRLAEQVLLQLTNVTQLAQEKVQELMNQHYKKESEDEKEEHKPLVYEQSCREHQLVDSTNTPGSTLLSEDRVHPNDAGYDYWGRHIAAAIVKDWNNETQQETAQG